MSGPAEHFHFFIRSSTLSLEYWTVYTVLIQLRRTHALGDFFRFVDRKPEAAALLRVWAKDNDVEMLRDFYYQDDRWKETACLELEESLSIKASLSVALIAAKQ